MKKILFLLISILCTFLFLSQASALLITYDDKGDFLTDTSAVSNGAVPNLGNVGTSPTLNDISFSAVNSIYFGTGGATITSVNDGSTFNDWTSLIGGADIAISGVENMDVAISLSGSTYAIGFDFVEPTTGSVNVISSAVIDSLFQVNLLDAGNNFLEAVQFNAPDDTAYFFGVWTDYAFSKLEIREIRGSNDNEFFGEFYIGSTAAVPEPATMILLGTGLLGLAVAGRKKFFKK